MVKVQSEPVDLVVIQVYMPTSDHPEEEIEAVLQQVEEVVDKQKGTDHVVIMGDWNAVVGEGREEPIVGCFGLGTRNESGQRLVDMCKRKKFTIANTWFQQPNRRRYTWKKPGDTGRYQIDYIMVRQRYHNSIKSAWSYRGADANADHNLVMMKCRVKLKKIQRCCKPKKWNVVGLKVKGAEYQAEVE